MNFWGFDMGQSQDAMPTAQPGPEMVADLKKRRGAFPVAPPANQANPNQIPITLQGGAGDIGVQPQGTPDWLQRAMAQQAGKQQAAAPPPTPGYPSNVPMAGSMFAPGFMSDPNAGDIARKYPQLAGYGGKLPDMPSDIKMTMGGNGQYSASPQVQNLMDAQAQKREYDLAQKQKYPGLQELLGMHTPLNASNMANPYSTQYDPGQLAAGQKAAFEAYKNIGAAQAGDAMEQRLRDQLVMSEGRLREGNLLQHQVGMGNVGIGQANAITERMKYDPLIQLKTGIAAGYGKQFGEGKTPTAVDATLVGRSINELRGVLGGGVPALSFGANGAPVIPSAPIPGGIGVSGATPPGIRLMPGGQSAYSQQEAAKAAGAGSGKAAGGASDAEQKLLDVVGAETLGKVRAASQNPDKGWYKAFKILHEQLGDEGVQKHQEALRRYLTNAAGGEQNIKKEVTPSTLEDAFVRPAAMLRGLSPWSDANVYTGAGRQKLRGNLQQGVSEHFSQYIHKTDEKLRQLYGWQD